MSKLLEIQNLTYKKSQKTILRDVNLSVEKGHFIALAGENGAGKTTLMRLISGIAKNYRGKITVDGEIKSDIKKLHVSYSDDLESFSNSTKIREIEKFYSAIYSDFSSKRYYEIAAFLDIDANNKLSSLSKGMRERLIIALVLARQTDLYLLDEPFSGIDIMSREKIIKGLLKWVDEKATVIISSHHLAEIENVIDEIIVIKDYSIHEHTKVEDIRTEHNLSIEEYFESIYMEVNND